MSNSHPNTSDFANLPNLGTQARSELVDAILADPHQAKLAKLSLRMNDAAQQTAQAMCQLQGEHAKTSLWRPLLLTGFAAAASFMFFSAPGGKDSPVMQPIVAQHGDRFGPTASFEGDATMSDRFGSGGFEAR